MIISELGYPNFRITPPKTKMTMEHGPFEFKYFLHKNEDFPLPAMLVSGVIH